MKRHQVLSQHGATALTVRGMTHQEARAYHHVYDERESDAVVMTWPRTIPMTEGDRGWQDMKAIEARLPELAATPIALMWAPEDPVFTMETCERMQQLLPHAEGPTPIRKRPPLPPRRPRPRHRSRDRRVFGPEVG